MLDLLFMIKMRNQSHSHAQLGNVVSGSPKFDAESASSDQFLKNSAQKPKWCLLKSLLHRKSLCKIFYLIDLFGCSYKNLQQKKGYEITV